ncbi:MAG: zf-HC2 domain-containing protein [Treponema sp.]|jgi:anti-sigma factor RsiW|nr:zf-HC2 domain-containing protein [Treponema sp.]
MCPEHQILSVYLDGELPSPWKEKMESHLEQCPQCRQRLESYRLVSASAAEDLVRMEAAKERVWRNLEAGERLGGRRLSPVRASVWRRSIAIPLPALAAAAAALIVVMGALWVRRPAEQPAVIPQMTFASDESFDAPGVVPIAADMNGVLQYLGSRDGGDILILRLPESRNFTSSGEPAILKAADYTRGQP